MADPISMGVMGAIGIGGTILGGVSKVAGAAITAQGQQLSIQGQMLNTIGKAFQYDVEAQEYRYKSEEEQYLAAVSKMNQQIALQNANYERDKGEVEASAQGMQDRYARGATLASQAASGIDVNSGSSTAVRESMVELSQYNQALIRANAAKVAYGYDVEATQHEAQAAIHTMTAALDTAQAQNATTAAGITRAALPLEQQAYNLAGTAGTINMLGSIASTAGSVATKWSQAGFSGLGT